MSEERLKKLEDQVAAMQEALYKHNLMARPLPKPLPISDAIDVVMRPQSTVEVPGLDWGVDLTFKYPCECGEVHSKQVNRVTGVRYGTVRIHTTTCPQGITTRAMVQIPQDPIRALVAQAAKDATS